MPKTKIIYLKNLVLLVTGGTSGLGKATAERFVRCGSQVIICDLPSSNGQNVAAEIGKNVQFIAADVRSRNSVQHLVEQIEKQYGKLNGVVNCAGIHNSYRLYNFNKQSGAAMEDFNVVIQVMNCSISMDIKSIECEFMNFVQFYRQIYLEPTM